MRKAVTAFVAGAVLFALPACGNKTDEHARAAGITPASAFAFLSVSLDPSIEQKRNLLGIARRFPEAEVKEDFDESRDDLLSGILEAAGLDYEQDVEPWLGSELAVAVLPGTDGPEPLVAVLIEQDDSDAAKAAIDKANARAQEEGGPPIAYRLVDDFVVATDGSDAARAEQTLDAFAADREDDSLSRSKDFADVVDRLHGDRLLLGWVDGEDAMEQVEGFLEEADLAFAALLAEPAPVAFDIHAARSAIVMEAVAPVTDETSGGRPELTEGLPEGSYGAFTVFDVRQLVSEGLEAALREEGQDVMAEFTRETGLDLEADVLSWMGGEAVLVASPGEEFPNFGLVVEPTDRAAAEAAVPKIQAALARIAAEAADDTGVQPAVELFEDRFVLASSPEYLEALSEDASPSFGEGDAYRSVLGELSSDETRIQFVLDIDAVRETFEGFMDDDDFAEYERDTLPNVEPLDAVGMVIGREDGFDRAELKLTFD